MRGFATVALELGDDLFERLAASVAWQELGKGRRGGVLTQVDDAGRAALVRTTTRYRAPAQRFAAVHVQLAQQLQLVAGLTSAFNNALIELYGSAYTKMGAHSDQAQDLADGSSIVLFSCYQTPALGASRKLVVEPKEAGAAGFELPLAHHSAVVFSLDTNRRYRHKIMLATAPRAPENPWLGVTFRTSKTWVQLRDGQAYLADGSRLTLADDEQARQLFELRARENRELDFVYPRLGYTISESDLMEPSA
jgi:hypothetical protein